MTYRVREYSRPIKMNEPIQEGMNPYWVYCSDYFDDYYEAILYAVSYHKSTGISCWVDCMDTYQYYDV